MSEDVKEAAESYRETFSRSEDPLFKLIRRFAGGAVDVGSWVGAGAGRVRDWVSTAGRSARESASGRGNGDTGPDAT